LLSPAYNDSRRALIGEEASHELRPGSPDGRQPRLSKHIEMAGHAGPTPAGAGEPTVAPGRRAGAPGPAAPGPGARGEPGDLAVPGVPGEPIVGPDGGTRGDTCHLDVVDRWGNMIAATPSGGWLQSNPVIPELGFPLGTRLQMVWLEDGLPNSLVPGRRPRTTLSPSLALRDGQPVMAFGTPGGDQQDQWSLHFFLSVTHGLDLQPAIDAPNWHTSSFPSSFYPRAMDPGACTVESRVGDHVIAELRRRGHDVTVGDPWSEGRLCAVARDPETGVLSAGANPRGMQGYAAGR